MKKKTSEPLVQQARPAGHTWRSPFAIGLFALVVVVGLASDLASKHYVFQWLLDDPRLEPAAENLQGRLPDPSPETMLQALRSNGLLSEKVAAGMEFTLSLNPGVVFGMPMPPVMVSLATLATIALVLGMFLSSPSRFYATHIALGLILAGALGNWYDRLFSSVEVPGGSGTIDRHVRDFIDFSSLKIGDRSIYPWIFNLADVFLVVGVILLLIHWVWMQRKGSRST